MLRQLLSSHDNGQSMVIYHLYMKHALLMTMDRAGKKHALSVVIVS